MSHYNICFFIELALTKCCSECCQNRNCHPPHHIGAFGMNWWWWHYLCVQHFPSYHPCRHHLYWPARLLFFCHMFDPHGWKYFLLGHKWLSLMWKRPLLFSPAVGLLQACNIVPFPLVGSIQLQVGRISQKNRYIPCALWSSNVALPKKDEYICVVVLSAFRTISSHSFLISVNWCVCSLAWSFSY